jgi:hypothetical protein
MDAKTGANIKTGTLKLGDKDYNFPIYDGTIGPEVIDISKLYAEAGIFTYDPGFTSTPANPRSPISTATRAFCSIAATRSTTWLSTAISSRPAISCSTANCPPPRKRPISSTA